jgi:hypothetical protein
VVAPDNLGYLKNLGEVVQARGQELGLFADEEEDDGEEVDDEDDGIAEAPDEVA